MIHFLKLIVYSFFYKVLLVVEQLIELTKYFMKGDITYDFYKWSRLHKKNG